MPICTSTTAVPFATASLPRTYVLDDYLRATRLRDVSGLVWHEFVAEDTLGELTCEQQLAGSAPLPMALVGLVDFAEPGLQRPLEAYREVREGSPRCANIWAGMRSRHAAVTNSPTADWIARQITEPSERKHRAGDPHGLEVRP